MIAEILLGELQTIDAFVFTLIKITHCLNQERPPPANLPP
jgi:hypothetical protein